MNIIKPKIIIIGVGGAGSNIVNHILNSTTNLDVNFILCNTDMQELNSKKEQYNLKNKKNNKNVQFIQLGSDITQGLGTGMNPEKGKKAAQESIDKNMFSIIHNADLVFIIAGIAGGTGAGAAPVLAAESKNSGALTISIAINPFKFEGIYKLNLSLMYLKTLKKSSDSILIIENKSEINNNDSDCIKSVFDNINEKLKIIINSLISLMKNTGLVNLDFADISTVIKDSEGNSIIGVGISSDKDKSIIKKNNERALDVINQAIYSPLLNNYLVNAQKIIVNISGGKNDLKFNEIELIINYILKKNKTAKIIYGVNIDNDLEEKKIIQLSIIATGIHDKISQDNIYQINTKKNNTYSLNEDNFTYKKNINNRITKEKLSLLEKIIGKNNKIQKNSKKVQLSFLKKIITTKNEKSNTTEKSFLEQIIENDKKN